jgi:hypothetical protein
MPYVANFSELCPTLIVLCLLVCLSSSCVHYVASFSGLCPTLIVLWFLVCLSLSYVPNAASFYGCLCICLVYPMLIVSLVVFVLVLCTPCC